MADPKNSKEGEGAQELNQTAREYLLFLDTVPDNADNVTPEVVARANTYAAALELIKDDPQFEPIVTKIREKFSTAMERIGLDPSVSGMSESWTYWDMAKQKHINDHPDEQDPRYRTGDPLADAEIQDQIASRHLGWEIYGNNSRFDEKTPAENPVRVFVEHESLANLDKDHANYPEIMELLKKDAKPENGTLSSIDLAKLGALIRQNLGEEDVSLPNSPSESEETDLPPALEMDSPARPFPPPDTMEREETGGRKSVLGRMWRGEYVTNAEKAEAGGWEKATWRTGKTIDIVASAFGARTLARLPDRWAKSLARGKEVDRIKQIIIEESELRKKLKLAKTEAEKARIQARLDALNLGEGEPKYNRIQRKMHDIRNKLEESDYLSPEKKAILEEKLKTLEIRLVTGFGDMDEEMAIEIDEILHEHVGERTKKIEYLKEAVSGVGVALGAFAIRAGALGAIALGERYKNLKSAKKENEKVSIKELIVDGAVDMAMEMFGQGKIKDLEGKQKAAAIGAAWAKTALPIMIAAAGYSEIAEKGGGAITNSLGRAGERIEEIQKSWQAVGSPLDLGGVIKAYIETMNFQETFHRLTMGKFKDGDGTTPDVAGAEPNTTPDTPPSPASSLSEEELRSIGSQHPSTLSQDDLNKVAGARTGDPAPGIAGADTSGADVPDVATEPDTLQYNEDFIGPREEGAPQPATAEPEVFGPQEASSADSAPSGPGPVESDAIYTKANLEHLQNNPGLVKEAETTFDRLGLTDEQRIELLNDATPESLEKTLHAINLESNFGVSSFDGVSPEDLEKVTSQLQSANAKSADELLSAWQESHPEITPYIQKARALAALEQTLGVNSFEGQVSPEELKKVISELTGENNTDADKLLDAWEEKGLVEGDVVLGARFPVEHASLSHAGFQVETTEGKIALSLDLGKEGAPQHLEQVFYRVAMEDGNIGEEITNVEGARILNVGANMTALSEGHNVAGVSAEVFDQYVTFEDGQLTISDYEGFQQDVLDKLTAHSEEIITADNVANTGAVAYLDNIKDATWADMAEPEAAEVNLNQAMIDEAEGPLFKAMIDDTGAHTGLGENITDINFVDEDSGTFYLGGEEVTVDNGMITEIGDTHFDEPYPLDSHDGHERLMEEANRIEAERIEAEATQRADELAAAQEIEAEAERIEKIADLTKEDHTKMLEKLGFGESGQGKEEWEFLKNKRVEDLLNKDIEGHSGRTMDYLEGRHRGKLRKLIELAIKNQEISDPSSGGPQKIGEAFQQIVEGRVTEQINADLHNASVILATPELTQAEAASASTLDIDVDTDGLEMTGESESVGTTTAEDADPDASTPSTVDTEAGDVTRTAGLEPIPSTEIPEGMTIKATPEADSFMREHGIRVEKGSIIGEKMTQKLDFMPESGEVADTGTTESVKFAKTDEGNLRATILDTDGLKDIVDVQPDGKIVDVQGTEGTSIETPASPQDIKLALENLVSGILANMDNVSPEILKSLDGVGLDDIAKLSDTTLLENMREGATDVLKVLQENPPADTDPQVIAGATRGYKEILATIETTLEKLTA